MAKPFRQIQNAPTLPARLDDGDQLYLRRLVEDQQFAQAALQKFLTHLGQRYQLNQADKIDLSGAITRAPAPKAAA